jgi:gas vesicle protein
MNSGKVLLMVVAGIAAGTMAGILFAPAKGEKTRNRLLKKGKNYSGALKEKSIKLLETAAVKLEKVMDDICFDDKRTFQPEEEVLQDSQII